MTYEEAVSYIHSRPRIKKTDDFKALKLLLKSLENPQDKLNIVHIAGTNGKGSCSKLINEMLIHAGYKTGLNISPFVLDFTERFSINNKHIDTQELAEITYKIKNIQEEIADNHQLMLTEFEIVTAIAFYYFNLHQCDIVCLEVGIGGLKDCTNIIKNSLISCIMNISYDHTEALGETLEKIAYQKGGIIKENQTVILYPKMDENAKSVLYSIAEKKNSTVVIPELNLIKTSTVGCLKTLFEYKNIKAVQCFTGVHQSYNAAVAVEAAYALAQKGFIISDDNIIYGIENAIFAARIEVVSKKPLIILDGAHNIDGVTALAKVLKENNLYNLTAVWATLSDKRPQEMLSLVSSHIKTLFTVPLFGPRAILPKELMEISKKYIDDTYVTISVESAINEALKNPGDGVLIFGSLYLASDARKILIDKNII